MSDYLCMISALIVTGVFSVNALAAWKYGADSRRDSGRQL